MKAKWFYPLQEVLMKKLEALCDSEHHMSCQYQVVAKDRVIEQYVMVGPNGGKQFLALMVKHGKENHTLLISELKLVASN